MAPREWASRDDISPFLSSKKSRKQFRSWFPFAGVLPEIQDPSFAQLKYDFDHLPERESYRLSRNFPILRSKIAIVHQQLSTTEPRGMRQLWHDTRDSAQWFTFWAVLVIGGVGIILSITQVALQAAQLLASSSA